MLARALLFCFSRVTLISINAFAKVSVDKVAIREQVKKAGFTPGQIEVADSEQTDNDSSAQSIDSEKANASTAGEGQSTSVKAIGQAAGVEGRSLEDGVVKVTWPRNDVRVQVDDRPLLPAAGLTSWASFKPGSDGSAVVMGDTVVFSDEVDVAMDAVLEHGLSATALHNHFFHDRPKVYFMHIDGHGSPEKLGTGVKLSGTRSNRCATSDRNRPHGSPVGPRHLKTSWTRRRSGASLHHDPERAVPVLAVGPVLGSSRGQSDRTANHHTIADSRSRI